MRFQMTKSKSLNKYSTAILVALAVAGIVLAGYWSRETNVQLTKESAMEHLTLASFKEKICECGTDGGESAEWKYRGTVPAVIDFYADWCGPCKMVSPILEQLSTEYEGRINIYKVNTEQERQLAGLFGISSIPSILFIPLDGQPNMSAGAMPKHEFKRMFREILGVEEQVPQMPPKGEALK